VPGTSGAQNGLEGVNSHKELAHKLHQMKQQGTLPITIRVDGNHAPIVDKKHEIPGIGPHFVTINDYDEKTGLVQITDQWGQSKQYNKAVALRDLYKNASTACA
jgi:hypothetical protein